MSECECKKLKDEIDSQKEVLKIKIGHFDKLNDIQNEYVGILKSRLEWEDVKFNSLERVVARLTWVFTIMSIIWLASSLLNYYCR